MRDVGTRGIVGITLNHALFVRQKKHKKKRSTRSFFFSVRDPVNVI